MIDNFEEFELSYRDFVVYAEENISENDYEEIENREDFQVLEYDINDISRKKMEKGFSI